MISFQSYNDKYAKHDALNPMDLGHLQTVNQTHASSRVSEKYAFIPTTRALAVMADYGWHPVQAAEARTRIVENVGYQKHMIRLANVRFNQEMAVGSSIPQIILINAHGGGAAFQLMTGIFEKICSNGLIVAKSKEESARVAHRGYADEYMEAAVKAVMESFDDALRLTDDFKALSLDPGERRAFAEAAIELRFDGEAYSVSPDQMLYTHRAAEKEPTLYNTLNIVQEKVIRGGVKMLSTSAPEPGKPSRRRQANAVNSINENVRLNKALWVLAERMAELKRS